MTSEELQRRVTLLEAEVESLRGEMRAAVAGIDCMFAAGRAFERGDRPAWSTPGQSAVNSHLRVVR